MPSSEPPYNPEPGRPPVEQPPPGWGQAPQPSPWGPGPQTPPPGFDDIQPEQPPGSWSPQPYNPYQQGYYPGYGQTYQRASQATTALVLSILGFFCCGASGIVGGIMGKVELDAIARGETDPTTRGTAVAATVLGVITALMFLAPFLIYLFLIIIAGLGSAV